MNGMETAIVAGGCFWCTEAVFRDVVGVSAVESGYIGGTVADPTYKAVCSGSTGHAEAIRVHFDPAVIGYADLLDIFFATHDPTQLNRQGPDTGTQYRTALVPLSEEQRLVASAYIAQLRATGLWKRPIVTRIERLDRFYPAEAEHQDFMAVNPKHPYIVAWDVAKVRALKALFPALYQPRFTKG